MPEVNIRSSKVLKIFWRDFHVQNRSPRDTIKGLLGVIIQKQVFCISCSCFWLWPKRDWTKIETQCSLTLAKACAKACILKPIMNYYAFRRYFHSNILTHLVVTNEENLLKFSYEINLIFLEIMFTWIHWKELNGKHWCRLFRESIHV